ncbi:MAG: hypothetical protein JWO15_3588 [Sphingomonadales bacterium]|nr:hypothetical protein [Sphingomonadales bacterium]
MSKKKTLKTRAMTTVLSESIFDKNNAVSANLEGLIRKIQVLEVFLEHVKNKHPKVYKEFFNVKSLPKPELVSVMAVEQLDLVALKKLFNEAMLK